MSEIDFEEMKREGRNWEEDYAHENGNYINKCIDCGKMFRGHKRRIVCKRCDPLKVQYTSDKKWNLEDKVDE